MSFIFNMQEDELINLNGVERIYFVSTFPEEGIQLYEVRAQMLTGDDALIATVNNATEAKEKMEEIRLIMDRSNPVKLTWAKSCGC